MDNLLNDMHKLLMKDLITPILKTAFEKCGDSIALTKQKYMFMDIEGVKPIDLLDFMSKNEVPRDAEFGNNNVCLEWTVEVPTTDEERKAHMRKRFERYAWSAVYACLTGNGWRRVRWGQPEDDKNFKDTDIYDMYIVDDLEGLVAHYSLRFAR